MTTTYNPNEHTSLLSNDRWSVYHFETAKQGMVSVYSVDSETEEPETSEYLYTNDAKSLFYSLIRQGYTII